MQLLFSDRLVLGSLTSEKAVPIVHRTIDDTVSPVLDPIEPQTCRVELILYWENAGMPGQEILSRCNAVKQP